MRSWQRRRFLLSSSAAWTAVPNGRQCEGSRLLGRLILTYPRTVRIHAAAAILETTQSTCTTPSPYVQPLSSHPCAGAVSTPGVELVVHPFPIGSVRKGTRTYLGHSDYLSVPSHLLRSWWLFIGLSIRMDDDADRCAMWWILSLNASYSHTRQQCADPPAGTPPAATQSPFETSSSFKRPLSSHACASAQSTPGVKLA